MITEYCKNGNLEELLNRKSLTELEVIYYFK